MQITTRANNIVTTEQVVLEKPCYVRMWFFLDLNDYVNLQKDDSYRHCENFTDHHGVTSVRSRCSVQTDRKFRMTAWDFHCLLNNRTWKADREGKYKCIDPDHFYDYRQHKGY